MIFDFLKQVCCQKNVISEGPYRVSRLFKPLKSGFQTRIVLEMTKWDLCKRLKYIGLPLLVGLLFLFSSAATAQQPDQKYLWISFGERQRVAGGAAMIPVQFNFGLFPATGGVQGLKGIELYYLIDSGEGKGWKRIVIPVQSLDRDGVIRIKSREHDRMIFRADWDSADQRRTIYRAESAYSRFTRKRVVPPVDEGDNVLRLKIVPQFHYWRQVGERVLVSTSPAVREILLLDRNLPPESIHAAADGVTAITILDDQTLNRQSVKAFKQTVLAVETIDGAERQVSTNSMQLHRNRTIHRHQGYGLLLFGGTLLLTGGVVICRRRGNDRAAC